MQRIVLRHLSGSKAQQIQEFPLEQAGDIVIGREPDCTVQYDPVRDDLVGKQHARILRDAKDPNAFAIVDLNSRNGTFVNRQRVAGTTVLRHGDVVQFGAGGPELRFELDPPPAGSAGGVKETRVAGAPATPPTRESGGMGAGSPSAGAPVQGRGGIGAETLERRIGEVRQQSRRSMWMGLAAAALLVVAAGGYYTWRQQQTAADEERNRAWTVERTASEYAGSTVMIEFAWKLVLNTGEQIYQQVALGPNKMSFPVFQENGDKIAPLLTVAAAEDNLANVPIACRSSGSGFVVTTDGFILTNRHVAANWEAPYSCFEGPAAVYNTQTKKLRYVRDVQDLNIDWTPTDDLRKVSGKLVEGQNVYLDVLFRLNRLRFPATLVRTSDRHDVALIRINTPQPVKKIELLSDDKGIQVGQPVIVMGYPGISPDARVSVESADAFGGPGRVTIVPDTTTTPGNIGRIITAQPKLTEGTKAHRGFGDYYQLTVTATGGGNSGGPVLDDRGRAIGIFAARSWDAQGTSVTFAVPIRYGLELMGTAPAGSSGTAR